MTSSFCLSAQSNSSVNIIAGVDYTYRHIRGTNPISETLKQTRNSEKGNVNWRFGLDYNHRLSSRFFLKTGVRLMSLGHHEEINFSNLRWGLQHDGNGGYNSTIPSGEDFGDHKISNDYWFLELPLVVRYEFSNKKFTPYVEAGLAPAYFLVHRRVSKLGTEREVTMSRAEDTEIPVQRIQLESIVAFGFNYNIKESIQLFGQPTFRYHLTKMWTTDLKEHLWSAGLEVGVRKWLN